MMNMLQKVENLLVLMVRVVLLAFSVFVLIGLALWLWDHRPGKDHVAPPTAQQALDWKSAKPDLQYVLDETARDLSGMADQTPMEKRLADPALRPGFQKADGLLRGFIYHDPAARKRVEKENSGQGLAPVHPLLKGDALPSAAEVQRQIKLREQGQDAVQDVSAPADTAAEAPTLQRVALHRSNSALQEAVAAAEEAAEEDELITEPVNLAAQIHDRAQAAESEHGAGAYAAFIQGLPAALEQVLGSAELASRLSTQSAEQITNLLLTNYVLSFDRTAQRLKGEDPDADKWDFNSMETIFVSLIVYSLVMVVVVLVLIRMERHMRFMRLPSGDKS